MRKKKNYVPTTEALKNVDVNISPPIEVYLMKKENISPQLTISINIQLIPP